MTAIEYFEKQVAKHRINLDREIKRNAPEDMIENIKTKIGYYTEAVSALEKQMPKKVVTANHICYSMSKEGERLYVYDYHCPLCDAKVNNERHHCPCGQALEWSDTE